MNSQIQEKSPFSFMSSIPRRLGSSVAGSFKKARKVGEDDPRRVVHAIKVGLALTLVSLFYYFKPLYDGFGQAGMWAILTVVVVFEFTVGGTLSKSINRGCATLVAGALGVGAEYLASVCGDKGEPVLLGVMVFFLAAVSTFMRFFPSVKRRYDYGVLIFILTFSLVAVSGFRIDQILQLAHQRLSTILLGGATCMLISIFVYPVWAGQDLHNLTATNIEKVAAFLDGFADEILASSACSSKRDEKSFLQGYKSVLNSKTAEENLANFAWWEPAHGRFKFHHPWQQYLKVGALTRECACLLEALINSKPQTKVTSEFQTSIQQACIEMCKETSKCLKEVASAIKKMTVIPPSAGTHAQNAQTAADKLKSVLENSSLYTKAHLQDVMPLLVIASVLIDIIKSVDKISLSVHELSQKASFKNTTSTDKQQVLHRGIVKPVNDVAATGDGEVVVEILETCGGPPEKKKEQPLE